MGEVLKGFEYEIGLVLTDAYLDATRVVHHQFLNTGIYRSVLVGVCIRVLQQPHSCRGEANGAVLAMEQLHSEFLLK